MDIIFSEMALSIVTSAQIAAILKIVNTHTGCCTGIRVYIAFELPAGYVGFTTDKGLTGGIDSDGVVST